MIFNKNYLRFVVLLITLVFNQLYISEVIAQERHPYASNNPIPYPKKFEVPGLRDFFGITFTRDGKTFYVNKFGIVKAAGTNPTAAILEYNFENGTWTKGKPLGFSMVKYTHDEAPFLSPDGKRIFFNSDRPDHRGNFNIYYAEKNDTGWSQAYQVKGKVNTSAQMEVSPAVAADGTLYFSTQLPSAGNGNFYYSKLLSNGEYDTPVKLSDSINTQYDEWGIYVSPDQNLMLFMSNRPGGYGKCDIYFSIKKNGEWSKAVNLGPKINTADDEIFSCISPDDNYLFFSRFSSEAEVYYLDWKPLLDSLTGNTTDIHKNNLQNNINFILEQNYPNPFNPETVIGYRLPVISKVKLRVFDLLGREITELVNEEQPAGNYKVKFSTYSFGERNLSSGIYLYNLIAGEFNKINKMVLMK